MYIDNITILLQYRAPEYIYTTVKVSLFHNKKEKVQYKRYKYIWEIISGAHMTLFIYLLVV